MLARDMSDVTRGIARPSPIAGALWTLLVASLATSLGCGPKEARDPREIIEEDTDYRSGAPVSEEMNEPMPDDDPGGEDGQLATLAECQSAVSRLQELAVDRAIAEEGDPARRAKMKDERSALLDSAAMKERRARESQSCVERETSQSEALCIASVQSHSQIDACTR